MLDNIDRGQFLLAVEVTAHSYYAVLTTVFFFNTQSENIEINTKLFLEKGQNNIIHFS